MTTRPLSDGEWESAMMELHREWPSHDTVSKAQKLAHWESVVIDERAYRRRAEAALAASEARREELERCASDPLSAERRALDAERILRAVAQQGREAVSEVARLRQQVGALTEERERMLATLESAPVLLLPNAHAPSGLVLMNSRADVREMLRRAASGSTGDDR